MAQVIGWDIGTQGTKGLVLDVDTGQVLARASRSYGLIPGLLPGAAEQHPDTWIEALQGVCAELLAQPLVDPGRFLAGAVSGQQHGCVVLDEQLRPVRAAKLWCDTATAQEAADLSSELGRPVPTGFTASKVRWLREHEADAWARTRHVMLPHDYVNLVLTGEITSEAGDASGTGYFDVCERCFDWDAASLVDPDLPGKLSTLIAADAPAGRVSAAAARRLGLPQGMLIAAGGGDNMLSAIGSGATAPGVVTLSLGTSGTVFCHADQPVVDPKGWIAPFCSSTGAWLPLLCVMNLTGVANEVATAFGKDHGELTRLARAIQPGCDGLQWLPYLAGERVPDLPHATGSLLGMRSGCLDPGRLYRAALEGTALNLTWGVQRLRDLGIEVERVHLVGGAAGNELWQEIFGACFQAQIVPLEEPESAALGAALQALWCYRRQAGETVGAHAVAAPFIHSAAGTRTPNSEWVKVYAELAAGFQHEAGRLY